MGLCTVNVPSARHETLWGNGFIIPFSTSAKNEMNGKLHGSAAFILGSSTRYQMNRSLAMLCCLSGCSGGKKNKIYLRQEKEISHFLKASVRELGPNQPPIQWITGGSLAWANVTGREPGHSYHLVSWLRMEL